MINITKEDIKKSIPYLPLSAVIFVIILVFLMTLGIIPGTQELLNLLESVYQNYGLIGVFIAGFLEGLVYIGLYFPGSMILVTSLFLTDGSYSQILKLSIVIALTFTLTSSINYVLGRALSKRKKPKDHAGKYLLLAMLHPHFISFYFFNEGLQKNKPNTILIVPFFLLLYVFLFGTILYPIGELAKQTLGDPINLILLMSAWFFAAFILRLKKTIKHKK